MTEPLRLMTAAEGKDPSTVLDVWLDQDEVIALIERAKREGYSIIIHDDGRVIFHEGNLHQALSRAIGVPS